MIYVRDEGGTIRQGFNFYPMSSSSVGCQMRFGRVRVEVRYSKRTKKLNLGWWLAKEPMLLEAEYIYIPGYTEFLEKCARWRFGDRPWRGVEPDDKFKTEV